MGWNNSIFPLLIITSGSGFSGLFVYSPAPGAGNLISSITAQSGTDPYGNPYVQGVSVYNASGQTAQLNAAALSLFNGVTQTILLNASGLTIFGTSPAVNFSSTSPSATLPQITSPNAGVSGSELALQSGRATAGAVGAFMQLLDSLQSASAVAQVLINTGTALGTSLTPAAVEVQGLINAVHIAAGDTTTYQASGRATKIATSTPQTVNSTTGQAVTGISFPVASAGTISTYELDALLFCTAGPNPVLPALAVTGPTTTFASFEIEGMDTRHGAAIAAFGGGNQVTMGALTNYYNTGIGTGSIPAADTFTAKIRGRFTTSASGTVGINVSTSAAANTYTINNGSYATLMPSA